MIKRYIPSRRSVPDRIKANQDVRYPQVRVIDDQGQGLGVMSSRDAYNLALRSTKDLVLVTEQAEPPVVKIIELSKFRYQLKQKEAKARKKNRAQEVKEIRLTMFMGEGDFQARINKAISFLKKGHKVRLTLLFKGREITKKDFADQQFKKFFAQTGELATLEIEPKMIGRKLMAQLTPAK